MVVWPDALAGAAQMAQAFGGERPDRDLGAALPTPNAAFEAYEESLSVQFSEVPASLADRRASVAVEVRREPGELVRGREPMLANHLQQLPVDGLHIIWHGSLRTGRRLRW